MELRRLEYFVALARERNFTRAAEQVSVSQPNLSKQIQELEREFGVPLIQKLGRQVHLTAPGEELLKHAERMLQQAEEIRLMMLDYRGMARGRLVVGSMGAPSVYLMPQVAARFKRALPDVELIIEGGHSQTIYQGLLDNSIHVGLAYLPSDIPMFEITPLFEEELLLVAPKDHPLADREQVAIRELANVPLTMSKDMACRRIIDQAFDQAGIEVKRSLEMASVEGLRATIEQGLGVTLLPKMYLRTIENQTNMALIRLTDPTPRETFGILVHRDRHRCTAMRTLIEAVQSEVERLRTN